MIIEKLVLSNYTIYKEKQSVIDKNATIREYVGIRCPQCEAILSPMESLGNSLICRVY